MEHEDDILQRAIEQYRNEAIPPHPPQAVVDATIAKLADAAGRPPDSPRQPNPHIVRLTTEICRRRRRVLIFAATPWVDSRPRPESTSCSSLPSDSRPWPGK